jgi:retron-type reverse transcriptase
MKKFEEYFKDEEIIFYLCRLRAKYAKNRNKKHLIHLLTNSDEFNYHVNDCKKYSEYERKYNEDLNKLLPSRRKWKNIGKESRLNPKTKEKLTSTDKNIYSLLKTIKFYKKKNPSEPFLVNLNAFIEDIQNSIQDKGFKIKPPTVYPKLKDKLNKKGENKCRPISLFTLKDRLILSLTNKYLTTLFDKYFEDCSFAFRAKRNSDDSGLLSHHDCIKEIVKFKSSFKQTDLWVVECDMEKFYDSVNHKIIKVHFDEMISKAQTDFPEIDFLNPIRIFKEFLNCYSFNINTLPLNTDEEYWKRHLRDNTGNTFKGQFGWVEDDFKRLGYYNDISSERIGIPQGGALSGLIANIVLNVADNEVKKSKVFYVRFCDDMIILHPDKAECELAKELYVHSLNQLKLVSHNFCDKLIVERERPERNLPLTTIAPFWNAKSKGPYKWSAIKNDGFPWIGFVGYELHFEGYIRVRKRSLKKELKKQKEVVNRIKKAIEKDRRKSFGTVSESLIHRLVGMSIGRVELRNFNKIEHEMCWKNGFKELSMNKYAVQQMKHLDRNRNKLYYKFEAELRKLRELEEASEEPPDRIRQIVDFNKPFSYYYQVLERKQIEKAERK